MSRIPLTPPVNQRSVGETVHRTLSPYEEKQLAARGWDPRRCSAPDEPPLVVVRKDYVESLERRLAEALGRLRKLREEKEP